MFGLFRSRASLQAEVLTLRQQLNVLQRKVPARPAFRSVDRFILSVLYRVAPSVLDALTIVRPVPIANLVRLAVERESGNPVVG